MRYPCYTCGKSVSSELPDDSVIRAVLVCPECIEADRVRFPGDAPNFPEDKPEEIKHEWEFYVNGSFCKKCGAAIGSGQSCGG
jgi:hypothetical protein